jgi:hypothetical protein
MWWKHVPSHKIKYSIWSIGLIFGVLLAYWLKCQLGINFFDSFSLSSYFPFNDLQRQDVLEPRGPGIILEDSFDRMSIIENWSGLWMSEKGTVSLAHAMAGTGGSRCLVVTSSSKGSWSYSHNQFVAVSPGDTFVFSGNVRLGGDNVTAYLGVAAFDRNKKAISWNYTSESTKEIDKWVELRQRFIVADGISYIKLKLSGVGVGKFQFDDIVFRKEG